MHSFLLALVIFCGVAYGDYTVTEEVWFDIAVSDFDGEKIVNNQDYKGRVVIAVFGDIAPTTVMNFVSIAKGYKRGAIEHHYKGSPIHRVVQDFVIQGGDVTEGDGTGGASIYGDKFHDEDFVISHKAPGVVSMANHGPDTNNSQFFVLLTKARWLDGHHVAFGKVIRGFDVVKTLGDIPTGETQNPKVSISIENSGINKIPSKYTMTDEQFMSSEDL